jgi:hypothetical protein
VGRAAARARREVRAKSLVVILLIRDCFVGVL